MGRHAANRKPTTEKKPAEEQKTTRARKTKTTSEPVPEETSEKQPAVTAKPEPEEKHVEKKAVDTPFFERSRPRRPDSVDTVEINIPEERNTGKIAAIVAAVAVFIVAVSVGIYFLVASPAPSSQPKQALSEQDKITEDQLIEAYNKGDYKTVIPRMENFVATHKDDVKLRDMLASAYLLNGRVRQALDEYEAILKITPNDAETLYKMGVLQAQTGRQNEAIATLNHAVQVAPNVALFHAELARIDTKAKYYAQALDEWKAVLNLLPTNDMSRADVFAEMANIYILQNDVAQAQGIIVTGLSLDPNNETLKTLKASVDSQNTSTQTGASTRGR